MSDTDRLKRAAERLGRQPRIDPEKGRQLEVGDGGPAEAVLHEIDETILGRRLRFLNARDEALSLIVAGRRLLVVESATISVDGLGEPIGEEAERQLNAFAAALRSFAEDAEPIFVTATPLGTRMDAGIVGRGADALRGILGTNVTVEASPTEESDPEDAFWVAVGDAPTLKLKDDAREVIQGDGDAFADLDDGTLVALKAQIEVDGSAAPGRAYLLSAKEKGVSLFVAAMDSDQLLIKLPADRTVAVMHAWSALYR